MAWLPLLLLLPLLFQLAITARAVSVTYNVGGRNCTWGLPPKGFSFQAWADGITWFDGDVLYFDYDSSLHDVWQFQAEASFIACKFTGTNVLGRWYSTYVTLNPGAPGSCNTVYFGSSNANDCLNGMSFSVTYETYPYSESGCFPSASPPPPTRTTPGPPPPPPYTSSRGSQQNKATVPAAAVAVPIVLVLVLGAGVGVFWFVRVGRRRAEFRADAYAAQHNGQFPPQSPLPTFDRIQVPNGVPGRPSPPAGASGYGA